PRTTGRRACTYSAIPMAAAEAMTAPAVMSRPGIGAGAPGMLVTLIVPPKVRRLASCGRECLMQFGVGRFCIWEVSERGVHAQWVVGGVWTGRDGEGRDESTDGAAGARSNARGSALRG